jgi:hypothetical protein
MDPSRSFLNRLIRTVVTAITHGFAVGTRVLCLVAAVDCILCFWVLLCREWRR